MICQIESFQATDSLHRCASAWQGGRQGHELPDKIVCRNTLQVGTYKDVLPFGGGIDAFPVVQVLRKRDEAVRRLGAVLPHVRLALILQSRHKASSTTHLTMHISLSVQPPIRTLPCAEELRQLP